MIPLRSHGLSPLVARALEIAESHVGLREPKVEGGSNRGPAIDEWLRVLGLAPGHPYCVAFLVVGCFRAAAVELGADNPVPRTGKAVRLWQRAPEWAKTQRPSRGAIFVRAQDPKDRESPGHAGIVTDVIWPEGRMLTVEANTHRDSVMGDPADREGDGIHRRSRPIHYANLGFLQFSREDPTPRAGKGIGSEETTK